MNIYLRALAGLSLLVAMSLATAADRLQVTPTLPPDTMRAIDRQCATLVEPYELSANLASALWASAMEHLKTPEAFFRWPGAGRESLDTGHPPRYFARHFNWLPMTAEVVYARRQHRLLTNLIDEQSLTGRVLYPRAEQILNAILATVDQPHAYAFRIFIQTESPPSPDARSGGYLYIEQRLLEQPRLQPQAYFAAARQISRMLRRHPTRALQGLLADSAMSNDELSTLLATARSQPNRVADKLSQLSATTAYTLDQELETDACTVKILSKIYPDRQMLAEVLEEASKRQAAHPAEQWSAQELRVSKNLQALAAMLRTH